MKLLLIRHGDPDYEHDCLTETGKREAAMLAERIAPMPISDYYVSTMGRAKETAEATLKLAGRTAVECDWLREFDAPNGTPIVHPGSASEGGCVWDWLPQEWLGDARFLSAEHWRENELFRQAGVGEAYDRVISSFDTMLAEHGYVRDGLLYRAEAPNAKTLALFCHLGLSCVLLSHLLNCSPMILWHGLAMAPTSVTTIYTEERRKGFASFRAASVGDISHLYVHHTEPSFSARFCEVYGDGTRID